MLWSIQDFNVGMADTIQDLQGTDIFLEQYEWTSQIALRINIYCL